MLRWSVGIWARTTGIDCLALIAILMFPRFVSLALTSLIAHVKNQPRFRYVEEQSHGALIKGDDLTICSSDATCRFLLWWFLVRFVDVSVDTIELPRLIHIYFMR